MYTVQLDEELGRTAVQHRQAQGAESEAFRACFPRGIVCVGRGDPCTRGVGGGVGVSPGLRKGSVPPAARRGGELTPCWPWSNAPTPCRYRKGGVASGMRHVETNTHQVRRLLHVKGQRRVAAGEVGPGRAGPTCPQPRSAVAGGPEGSPPSPAPSPGFNPRPVSQVELSWESFNLGDVFLLDLGQVLVQWNGPQSNRRERLRVLHPPAPRSCPAAPAAMPYPLPGLTRPLGFPVGQAMTLAKEIRDQERGGRAVVGVVDGEDEAASPDLMRVMTEVLGECKTLAPATPDTMVDKALATSLKLYQ